MTKEIQLTKGKVAIVDDDMFEYLNQWNWYASKDVRGYYYAMRRSKDTRKMVLMHRVVTNPLDGMMVDHINGDGLDNRRENLRNCTMGQNQANRGAQRNNQTGFKGVCWDKRDNTFSARIQFNGDDFRLGVFRTPEEAARAYDAKALELFGEFAKVNFP